MTITNRELPAGTILRATFKKTAYTCEVLVDAQGKRTYRLPSGKTFTSPSAAGSAVMGGTASNGWRFWSVEGDEPAKAETAPAPTTPRTRTTPKPKTVIQVKKARKQEGCEDAQTRWFCSACMEGFCLPKGENATACPQGHPREVVDDLASPEGDKPTTEEPSAD